MSIQNQNLAKLQEYAKKIEEAEYSSGLENGDTAYEIRLSKTVQHLQDQVKQHKDTLEKVCLTLEIIFGPLAEQKLKLRLDSSSSSIEEPSRDPAARIRQLEVITAAYKTLTLAEPVLPAADSPLPALLALRSTHTLIGETKDSIIVTRDKSSEIHTRLQQESDNLRDANSISDALTQRIEKLQLKKASDLQVPPVELVKSIIQEERVRKSQYAKGLRSLVKGFNRFVEDHLAGMLAAEELGGPVVGDILEVDEEVLKAGFSQHGKVKKAKTHPVTSEIERKRRIDDIWGPCDDDDEAVVGERSEKKAAGAAFRALCEDLLNAAAGDEGLGPYVDIPRETAAVRFLVRAKVAQYHPQNAKKLRLLDFTGDLDD